MTEHNTRDELETRMAKQTAELATFGGALMDGNICLRIVLSLRARFGQAAGLL